MFEKQVIGKWAVSGLFYFRSSREAYMRALYKAGPEVGLPALLDWRTKFYKAQPLDLIDLGTPQEYERFRGEQVVA